MIVVESVDMKTETKTLTVTPEAHHAVKVASAKSGIKTTTLASGILLDALKPSKAGKAKRAKESA